MRLQKQRNPYPGLLDLLRTRAMLVNRKDKVGELARHFGMIEPVPEICEYEGITLAQSSLFYLIITIVGWLVLPFVWPIKVILTMGVVLHVVSKRLQKHEIPPSVDQLKHMVEVGKKLQQPGYWEALEEIRRIAPELIPRSVEQYYIENRSEVTPTNAPEGTGTEPEARDSALPP